ncbi:hypothetical protein [Psychrilyobacter atlanticus]|uniref:hypothetical protein n=1 Tax=Psychrilyobacter atlanticus TaxID=271091 RepID=UPI0003F8EAB0|nr:hypothetical protein [Psychrilyobacter atlanticus]
MSDKISLAEELNLIQTQIQRMGNNSFIIKGWYVTIQLALGSYLYKNFPLGKEWFILVVVFLACSIYDMYFLRLERIYRKKYEWNIAEANKGHELSERLELNPTKIVGLEYKSNLPKKIDVDGLRNFYITEMSDFGGITFKVYLFSIIILGLVA